MSNPAPILRISDIEFDFIAREDLFASTTYVFVGAFHTILFFLVEDHILPIGQVTTSGIGSAFPSRDVAFIPS